MTTAVEAAARIRTGDRSRLLGEVWPLYLRALRNTLRLPSALIPPLVIPVFFLVVNSSALRGVSQLPQFPTDDYVAFMIPVAMLMTVASAGAASGMTLVQDIVSGYFDKLLLAPISRTSILLSRLGVDGTRAALQVTLVLSVGTLIGANVASGLVGALLLVVMAFFFGLAYAGISLTIALRTGNAEATQSSFVIFFPLVFLAPTFVPLELMAGWMQTAARFNPVTYVMLGMRSLTITGFDWPALGKAALAIGSIFAVTMATSFRALAARARR